MQKTFNHLNVADNFAKKQQEYVDQYNVTIMNNGQVIDKDVDSNTTGSQTQRNTTTNEHRLPQKRMVFSTKQTDA